MNKKGHSQSLVAAQPGNFNAVKSGAHSPRLIQARAKEIFEGFSFTDQLDELGQLALAEVAKLTAIIEAFDQDLDERGLTDARGKERYIVQLRERFSRQLLNAKSQVEESRRQAAPPVLATAPLDERAIARDRARGLTWPALAQKYGVSETECQAICTSARQRLTRGTIDDLPAVVEDVIAAHDAAIEDYAILFETSKSDTVRLASVKARLETHGQKLNVLKSAGLLPGDQEPWEWAMGMNALLGELGQVVSDYGLPDRAVQRLIKAVGGDGIVEGKRESSLNRRVGGLMYHVALPQDAHARRLAQVRPPASSSHREAPRTPSP